MPRTQLDEKNIDDQVLTGASMVSEIGIWDETINYSVNDKVFWDTKIYNCTTATTGTTEGILTSAPDLTAGSWTIVSNTFATATNGTTQTFSNTEVRVVLANGASTTEVTINTTNNQFEINKSGRYRISYKINLDDPSNTRVNPFAYIKKNNVQVAASKIYSYNRNSTDGKSSLTFLYSPSLTSGDKIDFFVINNSNDNLNTITNESYFEVEYIVI